MNCLLSQQWPGNIRQLDQAVRRILAVTSGQERVTLGEVQSALDTGVAATPSEPPGGNLREAAELRVIEQTLKCCNGNVSAAARLLKLSRGTMYKRLSRLAAYRR